MTWTLFAQVVMLLVIVSMCVAFVADVIISAIRKRRG